MELDILIGGSMALASVITSLAIVLKIARAVRETPRVATAPATPSGTAPGSRPARG